MWEFISKGGFFIYPLLLCSIISLAVIIERFISLKKFYRDLNSFLSHFNRSLPVYRSPGRDAQNLNEALELCQTSKLLLARVYQRGLTVYQSQAQFKGSAPTGGTHPGIPNEEAHGSFTSGSRSSSTQAGSFGINKETIRQAMQETATMELPRLEKNLKTLSTIAHIAPLLGFLGTVVGMIKAFQEIQNLAALGEAIGPGNLAGGIWEALITTAIGLCIAIPTYLAYSYFTSYVDKLINQMEKNTSEMLERL